MSRDTTKWRLWRPDPTPDGSGGQVTNLTDTGIDVRGDVRELVGRELMEARQAGAEHTHSGFFTQGVDIRRGDELRRAGQRLEVLSTWPAFPNFRMRVSFKSMEAGG
jgi:hypothetical protein